MDSFRIIRRIERLAYKLKLPNYQKIYSVFTIIMFEPGPAVEDDSYNRFRLDYLDSVFVNEDIEFLKSFKISKIIDKRVIYKSRIRKKIIEYFVRQTGYESKKNRQYNQTFLDKVKIFIEEYKRDFPINRTLLILLSDITTLNKLPPIVSKGIKKERGLSRKRGRSKKVQLLLIKELKNSESRREL